MRVTIMHNPSAGDEEHDADEIVEALEDAGHEARYQSTKKRKYARALDDPADVILVAGGDGTVRKVATRLVGRGVPMAILSLGTANNVVKALGAVSGLRELAEGLGRAERRSLDIGVVRHASGERRFIESFGGGSFARMVRSGSRTADAAPHLAGNKIDRALAMLRHEIGEAQPRSWELRIDGEEHSGDFLLVEVLNLRFIGPNVPLAPDADPGDGLLDVVAVPEEARTELLTYLESRIAGNAATLELPVRRGRRVELRVAGELLHVDDTPWPEEDEDDLDEDDLDEDDLEEAAAGEESVERRGAPADGDGPGRAVAEHRGAIEVLVVPQ